MCIPVFFLCTYYFVLLCAIRHRVASSSLLPSHSVTSSENHLYSLLGLWIAADPRSVQWHTGRVCEVSSASSPECSHPVPGHGGSRSTYRLLAYPDLPGAPVGRRNVSRYSDHSFHVFFFVPKWNKIFLGLPIPFMCLVWALAPCATPAPTCFCWSLWDGISGIHLRDC